MKPENDEQAILAQERRALDQWAQGNPLGYVETDADDITYFDDNCTSTTWLTLGKGPQPQSITTDAKGTGREELFRSVAAFPVGSEFDIHFRVVREGSSAVVLTSQCYQFTISQ